MDLAGELILDNLPFSVTHYTVHQFVYNVLDLIFLSFYVFSFFSHSSTFSLFAVLIFLFFILLGAITLF